MKKKLLIVESPTKAKTISRYLPGFRVRATMGHIKDLPEKSLGVDIERGFLPRYILIKGKKKIVEELKKEAKEADDIFIATDPDREGEAIAFHVAQEIASPERVKRVLFYEITPEAVKEAVKTPGEIDKNKVLSQQARRILDRLVGYRVSPLLWKIIKKGLSAGRVQSVALRLVCEREEEIEKFVPQEYWIIEGIFKNKEEFKAKLSKIDGKKVEIKNKDEAEKIEEEIKKETYRVKKFQERKKKVSPPPPYITSTLQQDASRKLKFPAKYTMQLAQQLFEGVDIGGERVGLITYHRTDAVRVADKAKNEARKFIEEHLGKEFLPEKPREYKTKETAQGAHEAIRPTSVERTPEAVKDYLTRDQYRLYSLIWKRFLASQARDAEYAVRKVELEGGKFLFTAQSQQLVFEGFMKIYGKEEKEKSKLPELKEGEEVKLIKVEKKQEFTKPKPRYTEGTLIKELEEKGIGRPSTYATIVSTILERGYVKKENGYLVPQELGRVVNKFLVEKFPEIFNVEFTAKMEEELDRIEEGKIEWRKVLEEFYSPFSKKLDELEEKRKELKKEIEVETEKRCKLCGSPMVIKWGKFGKFLSCSRFPECKYTEPLDEEKTGEVCPECGSPLVVKTGKFGKFVACSSYPECNFKKPFTTGVKCECGKGEFVEKVSRKKKKYWVCSNPECGKVLFNEPVSSPCPACGHPYRVKKGKYLVCPSCGKKEKVDKEKKEV